MKQIREKRKKLIMIAALGISAAVLVTIFFLNWKAAEKVVWESQPPEEEGYDLSECRKMIEQIKRWDFSCVEMKTSRKKDVYEYIKSNEKTQKESKWVERDLNQDGNNELILQQIGDSSIEIFTYVNGKMKGVLLGKKYFNGDYFLSNSENIIYTDRYWGDTFLGFEYSCYRLDNIGNLCFLYKLGIKDYNYGEGQEYYKEYDYYTADSPRSIHVFEDLTGEEFLTEYREMTGNEFPGSEFPDSQIKYNPKSEIKAEDGSNQKTCEEIIEMIKAGDLSYVITKRGEPLEKIWVEPDREEWLEYDVNQDGNNELILQMFGNIPEQNPILALFTYKEGKMKCTIYDLNDFTEYYYLSRNGNLIYTNPDSGPIDYERDTYCTVDEKGNLRREYKLNIIDDYENGIISYSKWTAPETEDETGIDKWKHEKLTREEYLAAYEEMTGRKLVDERYTYGNTVEGIIPKNQ